MLRCNDSVGKLVEVLFAYKINGNAKPVDFRRGQKDAPNTINRLSEYNSSKLHEYINLGASTFTGYFNATYPGAIVKEVAWVSNKKDHEKFTGVHDANTTVDVMVSFEQNKEKKYHGVSVKFKRKGDKMTLKNVGHNVFDNTFNIDLARWHDMYREMLAEQYAHLGFDPSFSCKKNKEIYKAAEEQGLTNEIDEENLTHKKNVAKFIETAVNSSSFGQKKQFLIDSFGVKPTIHPTTILHIQYDTKGAGYAAMMFTENINTIINQCKEIECVAAGTSVDFIVTFGNSKYKFQVNVKNQSGPFSTLNYPARYYGEIDGTE